MMQYSLLQETYQHNFKEPSSNMLLLKMTQDLSVLTLHKFLYISLKHVLEEFGCESLLKHFCDAKVLCS